ncbi:alpha/beta hydrolase [Falsibacillus albus]|uniref:Alpha/beta fold hydrolase n=1 Tax=Falsibacillus albus TaxID=2478915 RepID=A0A3L7JR21_9BACI|nr:alpha/beta fold hydrolase [Falsibacillus albus]RLQ93253.1 alpha/beta fold hydrolase [Falsibacillus albus]
MIGCLCIHGFTGAPYEVAPLVDYLKRNTDWEVAVPTLPGHGETLQLKGVAHSEWIDCAEKALQDLLRKCEEVYLIGFSMGGLIASYLAVKYPIKKLVLLSAAAYYINVPQIIKDIKEMIGDTFNGNLLKNELFLRYKRKIMKTPLSATREFRKIVMLSRPQLRKITIPTLIVQGEADGIVPKKSAEYLYKEISSEQKILRLEPNAKHLICHCDEQMALFDEIFCFLTVENINMSAR